MDGECIHAEPLHHLHAVVEGEGDAFLSGAEQMGAAVPVEVKVVDGTTGGTVSQHPFGAVAEGDDADALAAHRDGGGERVDVVIGHTVGDVAFHPGVEDTAAVDAVHDA